MTAQTNMKPSTAPTIEQMAKRTADAAPLPLCRNAIFQHEGELFLLSVYHDTDAAPTDYDCYDADRVEQWHQGAWNFIGFEVVLARHPDANDALWGIEDDSGPEHFAQLLHDLCAEIMHRVNGGLCGDDAPTESDAQ